MAYTLVPTELIVDGAITSAKLDTNIAISGTLGVTGEVTLATHLIMGDNDKIKIGTGGDLEIYHDGSNSYISNSTGNIYLGDTNGAVHIQAKLNEESIICAADGAVTLYHDNSPKLATSSAGVTVTGTLAATLSTAAQPNITSLGTLTGLTSSAAIVSTSNSNSFGGTTFTSSISTVGLSSSAAINSTSNSNSLGGTSFTSDIDVTGTATMDGLTVDGTTTITKTGTNAAPHIKLTESGDTREFNIYNDGSGNGRLVLADTDDTPDTEIVLADNGIIQFKTANTERMQIHASGCIDLGANVDRSLGTNITTTVTSGSAGSGFWLSTGNSSATSSKIISSTNGSVGDLLINQGSGVNGGSIRFSINDSEKMRINSNDQVCIGNSDLSGALLNMRATPNVPSIETRNSSTGAIHYALFFRNNAGTEIGFIKISNTGTTYDTGSDYRLKENAEPIQNGLERLNQLNPVKFDWKEDGTSSEGFIAHEVQEIFPDAVSGEKDAETMQGMDYGRITPLLVKAIQEQQTIIDNLKTRIETLEG